MEGATHVGGMEPSTEEWKLNSLEDARYRLRLAAEHLEDAEFEFQHARWSKAALSAQLSVENAAKATIALFSPTAKTHYLASDLLDLVNNSMPGEERDHLRSLADYASKEPRPQGGAFENPKTISTACHETRHKDISCDA